MTTEQRTDPGPSAARAARWPLGVPHPAMSGQQAFAAQRLDVLRRARVSGLRLVAALALVLDRHRPENVLDPKGHLHLRCAECRPADRSPGDQWPCPTAQHTVWALDATLS